MNASGELRAESQGGPWVQPVQGHPADPSSTSQALSDLRADNQRLKDENAALIRVISKLSK